MLGRSEAESGAPLAAASARAAGISRGPDALLSHRGASPKAGGGRGGAACAATEPLESYFLGDGLRFDGGGAARAAVGATEALPAAEEGGAAPRAAGGAAGAPR